MVDYELVLVGANQSCRRFRKRRRHLPVFGTAHPSCDCTHTDRIAYEGRKEGFTFLTQHIPVIYGCRPLTGSDGSLYRALFILIPEQSLRQFYQSFSSQSTSILLSSDGTILSSNLTDDIGEKNQSHYCLPGKIRSGTVSTLSFLVVGLFIPLSSILRCIHCQPDYFLPPAQRVLAKDPVHSGDLYGPSAAHAAFLFHHPEKSAASAHSGKSYERRKGDSGSYYSV